MSALAADLNWFFTSDAVGRAIGLAVWIAISFLLMPAVARCIRQTHRYSDPLFFAGFLLTLNRIAFGVQGFAHQDTLADVCRWTGIATAIGYGFVALDYLRSERGR